MMPEKSGMKITSDLYRYDGDISRKSFYRTFIVNPGFRFSFYLRKCAQDRKKIHRIVSFFWRFLLWRMEWRYHNHISPETKIGYGLYIGYGEFVTITSQAVIGNNFNINHGAVIGIENRGKNKGAPTIGNNVWIGTHAVVVGNITIGNNVLIAPLTHVNFDVPDNAVVAGNPGKIISFFGTEGYVNNKWNCSPD